MLWTYKHSIGALIEFLVKHTTIHTPLGNVPLLFPLAAANNFIMASMSTAALGLEVAGGRFFHALGVIVGWMVNLALYTATTMEHGFSWLRHVHIPKAALWAARVAFPLAWLTKLIAEQVAKAIPHTLKAAKGAAHAADVVIYRYPKAIGRRLTKTEKTLAALAAAIAALGGHVIHPGHTLSLPKSWYGLTKRLARLERRMHRAEGWLAVGALAAVMAQVLGVTARCLRSGNVGKATRSICGMDEGLLQSLLGDALLIVGAISVVAVAEGLLAIEDEAVAILGAGIREWPS